MGGKINNFKVTNEFVVSVEMLVKKLERIREIFEKEYIIL